MEETFEIPLIQETFNTRKAGTKSEYNTDLLVNMTNVFIDNYFCFVLLLNGRIHMNIMVAFNRRKMWKFSTYSNISYTNLTQLWITQTTFENTQ